MRRFSPRTLSLALAAILIITAGARFLTAADADGERLDAVADTPAPTVASTPTAPTTTAPSPDTTEQAVDAVSPEEEVAEPTAKEVESPKTPAPAAPLFTPIDLIPGDTTPGLPEPSNHSVVLTNDPAAAGVSQSFQVPGVPSFSPYNGGISSYSVGGGCAASCILSGVATTEGPHARLTVTTSVPTRMWIVVWNDHKTFSVASGVDQTEFSHLFDELELDTTYSAMAVAEDAAGYTDHRYGELTTLQRMIKVSFDHGQLLSVPDGTNTDLMEVDVWLNGVYQPHAWDDGIAPFGTVQDTVDLRIRVIAHHPRHGCFGQPPSGSTALPTSSGHSDTCFSWMLLAARDGSGAIDPVSVLHDPAVEESDTYRRVERTLIPDPSGPDALDAIATVTVEVVYL